MPKSILFMTPYIPNAIRVRPFHFIRSLAAKGHQISLVAVGDGQVDEEIGPIGQYCRQTTVLPQSIWRSLINSVIALPGRTPLQAVYSWNPRIATRLRQELRSAGPNGFDLIHIEHLRGARYGLDLRRHADDDWHAPPIVWDSVDCITALFEATAQHATSPLSRWVARLEIPRTRRYERWLLGQFDRVLVTSQFDRESLLHLSRNGFNPKGISVIPNGVDLAHFREDTGQTREAKTLIITGKMSYHANVTMVSEFVERIFPHVLSADPEVKLWIVGKDPPKSIRGFGSHPNIWVSGTVPELRDYLIRATCAVVPLAYGVGIQNKVLEAMASGTPVVSTSKAVRALQVTPGKELLVADSTGDFVRCILKLLENSRLRETLARSGRDYVKRKHDWSSVASQLEAIYADVVDG